MADPRKTPTEDSRAAPRPQGVEETHAEFEGATHDRWAIARQRLAEYRRTGETISVDEFMAELDHQVELLRANKA